MVASAYQVYRITGSSLQVGLVSLVQLGPLIVCSFIGGALADAFDRRRVLLVTQVLLAFTSVGLAVERDVGPSRRVADLPPDGRGGGPVGIDAPTRTAAIPSLVGLDLVPAAAALNQTLIQLGQVVGPALAGLVIAQLSLGAAYWFDVATFGAAIVALLMMAPMIPAGGGTRAGLGLVKEGSAT